MHRFRGDGREGEICCTELERRVFEQQDVLPFREQGSGRSSDACVVKRPD